MRENETCSRHAGEDVDSEGEDVILVAIIGVSAKLKKEVAQIVISNFQKNKSKSE